MWHTKCRRTILGKYWEYDKVPHRARRRQVFTRTIAPSTPAIGLRSPLYLYVVLGEKPEGD